MKSQIDSVKGVIVPLVTPINENEDLNEPDMRRLIDHVIEGGVDAIFVLGTSGEFIRFDDNMRDKTIACAVRFSNGRKPVFAGISDGGTKRVLTHIKGAVDAGADAVVCTMPYYIPNQCASTITKFFCDIANASEIPLILYNIPSCTGAAIPLETLDEIASIPNIVAIKDSGSDISYTAQLIERYAKKGLLSVLVGNESILYEAFSLGVDGMVPSLANPFPRLLSALYASHLAGNDKQLAHYCGLVDEFNALNGFCEDWMSPNIWRKIALGIMGISNERFTQPVLPVDENMRELVSRAIDGYHRLFPEKS
ncbi:MAG: dihydrodipicolinate synthase family protein [Clostridia bacterium]|nr:dihydrodipicolinate synthase family protein [Clostridia bacterium]